MGSLQRYRCGFVVWRTSRVLCVTENFGSVPVRTASLSLFADAIGMAFAAGFDCECTAAGRSLTGTGNRQRLHLLNSARVGASGGRQGAANAQGAAGNRLSGCEV